MPGDTIALLYKPPLLLSESKADFDSFYDFIKQQISPRDAIEGLYVNDLVEGDWEILRLRGFKIQIVKMEFCRALKSVLRMVYHVESREGSQPLDKLVERYFTSKAVKKKILARLLKYGFDESSIYAEAFQSSMEKLKLFDDRIAELEARRDKILRSLDNHRAGLATRVRASSEPYPDDDSIPTLIEQVG